VQACIKGEMPQTVGADNMATLSQTMHEFDAELHRRGLSVKAYPGVEDTYRELQHPITVLSEFFQQDSDHLNDTAVRRARIITIFLQDRFTNLRDMACEIDAYYEKLPEDITDKSTEGMPDLQQIQEKINQLIERSINEEDALTQTPPERTLADWFRDLSYEVSKIREGTSPDSDRYYPMLCFGQALKTLEAIIEEMQKRSLSNEHQELTVLINELSFPVQMLTDYFDCSGKVSTEDADIYAWYLSSLCHKLRALAIHEGIIQDNHGYITYSIKLDD